MVKTERPESLEGRWDILYRDYPEVYDEWEQIPKVPDFVDAMITKFPLKGKTLIDVGSGSGISTFKLAKYADAVKGVEVEQSMISLAAETAKKKRIENVSFHLGNAENLPFEDSSVDAVFAYTLAGGDIKKVATEMERVAKPGGFVLRADIAPGWYGGDIMRSILGQPSEIARPGERDDILIKLGYAAFDVNMVQEYDSPELAIRTYGFIHSKHAIDYIRNHNLTTIHWKVRGRSKIIK